MWQSNFDGSNNDIGGDLDGYNSYAQRGYLPTVEDVCEGGMAIFPALGRRAWVCFDITGLAMDDLCEHLCSVPIRQMVSGDVQRTAIHQLECFIIRRTAHDHIQIIGPRASAGTLHHALITAAHSTT